MLFFIAGVGCVLGGAILFLRAQQAYGAAPEELVACPDIFPVGEQSNKTQMITAISGGVVHPGMYSLPVGARVGDIVEAAGGFSSGADPLFVEHQVNLAQQLTDGEGVYVPTSSDTDLSTRCEEYLAFQAPSKSVVSSESTELTGLVSINTASIEQLDTLPGIGEKRAEAIVEGRPYSMLHELVERKVVTESVFADIESLIQL